MKRLIFDYTRRDKNDPGIVYERYDDKKKGPIYEIEDDKRAKEMLKTKTKLTNEAIAREYKGNIEDANMVIKIGTKNDNQDTN